MDKFSSISDSISLINDVNEYPELKVAFEIINDTKKSEFFQESENLQGNIDEQFQNLLNEVKNEGEIVLSTGKMEGLIYNAGSLNETFQVDGTDSDFNEANLIPLETNFSLSGGNDDVLFQTIIDLANGYLQDNILTKAQYTTLVHFISTLQSELGELQDHTISVRERIASIKRSYDLSLNELRSSEKDYVDKKIRVKDLSREMIKAEKQISLAHEQESELLMEIVEKERQIVSLEQDILARKNDKEKKEQPIIAAYSKDIHILEKESEDQNARIQKYTLQRQEIFDKIKAIKDQIRDMKEKNVELHRDFEIICDAPNRSKQQLEIVKKACQSTQKDLEYKINNVKQLQATISEQNKKKEKLIDTTFVMKKQEDHELKKLIAVEKETKEYKSKYLQEVEIYKMIAGYVFSHEQDLSQHKKSLTTYQDILRSKKKELQIHEEQLERLKKHNISQNRGIEKLDKKIMQLAKIEQGMLQSYNETEKLLMDLKTDVDISIHQFLTDEKQSRALQDAVNQKEAEKKELEEKVKKLEHEERDIDRTILSRTAERESIAREATKSKQAFLDAVAESKSIGFVNEELRKVAAELDQYNKKLKKVYAMIKRDRNKLARVIQDNMQTIAQITNNKSILESEHEVLSKNSVEKEKLLMKLRRQHDHHFSNREKLRSTFSNLDMDLFEKTKSITECENEIAKRNIMITSAQNKVVGLKKSFENRLEQRNYTNIQLMDRNDELAILYEKSHIQESIIKKGETELSKRIQESNYLAVELGNFERKVELLQRRLPEVKAYESEKSQLQSQIEDMNRIISDFATEIHDSTQEDKWRTLSGDNVSEVELDSIGQDLQTRIMRKKELLMEKKLVLKSIKKSSKKLQTIAASERSNTLDISLGINEVVSKIRGIDLKMMSVLSELSIYQATVMTQGAQIAQMTTNYERGLKRLESNEAPSEEVEWEWEKYKQLIAKRKQQMKEFREKKIQIEKAPATITRTTAIQRPTSYLPQDGIPIPKPYGFKPFMFTENGGNIRHFRKPTKREITL